MRGVLGQPARDRVVVRADPRAQQHQHRPADGRSRDAPPARGRRAIPLDEFTRGHDAITALIIESGGLLAVLRAARQAARSRCRRPAPRARPMNLTEKILAAKLLPGQGAYVKPGDAVLVTVDAGYSHEFTTAQVDLFLAARVRRRLQAQEPVEVRRVRGPPDLRDRRRRRWRSSPTRSRRCATLQRAFAAQDRRAQLQRRSTACRPASATRSRASSSSIRATSCRRPTRHTCMGGASGALAWGVGATEYAALALLGLHADRGARVDPLRADRQAARRASTAKDVMLHILATYAKREETLNRVMEFGGDGLFALSPDERATLANMATECSRARRGDGGRRHDAARGSPSGGPASTVDALRAKVVTPDPGAHYDGGVHRIDLAAIRADGRDAGRSRPRRSRAIRRTARSSPRSARSRSTSRTAARAPRASATTSTCTRA